ncbi:MAG: hypothetical protein EOO01_42120, partial [Chitinophagaceae bacterium]
SVVLAEKAQASQKAVLEGAGNEASTSTFDFADQNGLFCSSELWDIADCNIYIVTVPTPVDKYNRPDLTPLYKASETVGKVLSQNDRDDIAYKIMNQKDKPGFGYLLDDKNSQLWEEWGGDGSHSHPMFGSVIGWFYSGIAGIHQDGSKDGIKHFIIKPNPVGDLTYCKASYNSSYGMVRSEWKISDGGNLEMILEIPANTSATFVLPPDRMKLVDNSGKSIPIKKVNNKYEAEFPSGVYRFQVF